MGRVFTLRQHKNFPCYYKNKERIQIDPKEIGEAVLVFDETNTRVKISLANGSFVWVPKFYLHKEISLFDGIFDFAQRNTVRKKRYVCNVFMFM